MLQLFSIITALAGFIASPLLHAQQPAQATKPASLPNESFMSQISPILKHVQTKSKITLHEGLPHQLWDKELLAAELKKQKHEMRQGFAFYVPAQSSNIVPEDRKQLLAILADPESYEPYSGPKRCGGYHPDFSVEFQSGKHLVEIQLCFGCHESKLFLDGKFKLHTDLKGRTMTKLEPLLRRYHQENPRKEHYLKKIKEQAE
ncbi:hypothetical protein Rhal01_02159 [Rubritalea halochordaticola]|uniref:Cytochrome c domain-containing protein n=1 Tax=Rubritalea halochordaticola TaxID=714537 RepID=A0ABP9UZW1_9BACT